MVITMASLGVSIEGKILEILQKLEPKILEAQEKGVLEAAEVAAGEIRRQVFSLFKPGRGGLARSFKAALMTPKDKGSVRAGALSDLEYAKIQDEGGTIRQINYLDSRRRHAAKHADRN